MDINAAVPSLLGQITSPNTEAIRSGELELKRLKKDPQIITALMGCLTNVQAPPAVRNVAAVMTRKYVHHHYATYPAEAQAGLKAALLNALGNEPERSVRIAVVGAITKVADLHPNGLQGWPELLNYIVQAAQHENVDARDLSFVLLRELATNICESMPDQFPSLVTLFSNALTDTQLKVRSSAVKALGETMRYVCDEDQHLAHFAPLLPMVLEVTVTAQKEGNEDLVQTVCEVLYELTMNNFTTYFKETASFAMGILCDGNLELVTRDAGALVMSTLIECKPKLFGKKCPVDQITDAFMMMIETAQESAAGAFFDNNPQWRDDDDSDDEDENYDGPTQCGMAQGCLDIMACTLPSKVFFNLVMTKCMQRMASANGPARKAGIAALGVVAEGIAEKLTEHLTEVMPHVLRCAGDQDPQVRECSCFALGQLAEHCQPEILDYASQVLPCVFKLLDDNSVSVQTTSCYVLEMFCEHLEPDSVLPFLQPLTTKLVTMLESTKHKAVQEMSVAAISATAVAAEKEFIPYLPGVASIMSRLMNINDEKAYPLKGRALESMGHMAVAVEKDAFRPYFEGTMQATCSALTLDSTELHEYAFAVFANLSKVMEREFSPVLPELVPHLLSVIAGSDAVAESEQRKLQEAIYSQNNGDDSDEEDGGGIDPTMMVSTAMMEAKKAAVVAIAEMASHCGQDFTPYIPQAFVTFAGDPNNEKSQGSIDYWHPAIKEETLKALPSLLICCVASEYPSGATGWEKGNLTQALLPQTQGYSTAVMAAIVPQLMNPEKEVVGTCCNSIQSIIELCGPQALLPVANDVLNGLLKLVSKKAVCQSDIYSEEEEEDEDDDHETWMNGVLDLIGAIGRVMGAHFAQYLNEFMPHVLNFAKTSCPTNDRSMAIGLLGELAQGLGPAVAPYFEQVYIPQIQQGCADEADTVRRNAAFTAGMCCEALGEAAAPAYPAIMQALHPIFTIDATQGDAAAAAVDNAAAALARMIIANPNSIPYGQVLPVFFAALPLKSDLSETEVVFECIVKMAGANQPDMQGALKGEVQRVVMACVGEGYKVEEELKGGLKKAFGV